MEEKKQKQPFGEQLRQLLGRFSPALAPLAAELRQKHFYGLLAIVIGFVALIVGLLYWFITQTFDLTVQVALGVGLVGLALFVGLEADLLARLLKTRQARYGFERTLMVVVVLGVVALLNYILAQPNIPFRNPFDKNGAIVYIPLQKEWDLTETKQHSLTPETQKVLAGLTEPLKIYCFYSAQVLYGRDTAEDLVKSYKSAGGGRVDYEFIDPVVRPTLASEHGYERDGSLVVEMGGRREQVSSVDETALTNAIMRLTNPEVHVVYFVTGHGEQSTASTAQDGYSDLKSTLEQTNYKVEVLPAITETIPADASILIIAGPKELYSQAEVETIDKYLSAGGKAAIFLIDPVVQAGQMTNDVTDPLVEYLAAKWGLRLRSDLVIDPRNYFSQFGPTVPAAVDNQYSSSPIVESLKEEGRATFFLLARSIEITNATEVTSVVSLGIINTSPFAWGETDYETVNDRTAQPDETEAYGQLALAATAENTLTRTRVVVFGDSDFAVNSYMKTSNGRLLPNSLRWALRQDELISLSPKPDVARAWHIYEFSDYAISFLLACLMPPALVLVGAAIMWWTRRTKNA